MSLGINDSYDNLIKRISNKNVKIEFGLCIIFAQLLRIRKYNTYLTKIVLKLTNKKKMLIRVKKIFIREKKIFIRVKKIFIKVK